MTSTMALFIFLLLGLGIGIVLGWALRSSRPSERDQQLLSALVRDGNIDSISKSLTPLEKAMGTLSGQVRDMEIERAETFAQLSAQVQAMNRTSLMLSDRTDKLVTALRAPQVRGRWGEMQLERVVELSGMVKHCDFDTQVSTADNAVRPDVVIRMSDGRNIVVDAKVPFLAYLDALDTTDPEEHQAHLRRHANHLRTHITQLSGKNYVRHFQPTPEFIVLFVPADPFLDAALSIDNELLEYAFSRNVVLATPTTLVALLRTVGLGWQHSALSDTAAEIQKLGSELYRRLGTSAEHLHKLGTSLNKSVEVFNQTVASLDSRVFVTARKLHELDALPNSGGQPPTLPFVDMRAREPRQTQE
ncbi:DNA recombination protein RmuC [Corynebacterium hindlerae]|uniref:DNA recombination protein RmuC n=1 Tax=Corynebacterium hindlerae TaxID=699041 RepID=A0A7G5FGE5_9CORY|nr:DNA recombination protein RmuC [Corynebacterium hindlerae]QMV85686.1 DNA recombination protein RmuC [Corynebacterium hindlerae]